MRHCCSQKFCFKEHTHTQTQMGKVVTESASKIHIMMIPFPAQGHMSPMMQFAKRLSFKGVKVTIVVPTKLRDSINSSSSSSCMINIECIAYDFNKDEIPYDMVSYMGFFKLKLTNNLSELLEKQKDNGCPVKLLVLDSLFPSGVELCHNFGLKGAPFFTQSSAVNAIYFNVLQGNLKIPLDKELSAVSLPSLPSLDIIDMPINEIGFPDLWSYFANQFLDLDKADWVFINTFDKLEHEETKWLSSYFSLTTVGPAIPSMYLDKKLVDDKEYGISLYKAEAKACLNWLDNRDYGTVVYVSFGSVDTLSKEYIDEIAKGLLQSEFPFLWAIRDCEREKLSSDFLCKLSDEKVGLVVSWCPQVEVLAHRAVGSFMTHCGWNSTLEALSLGVPIVAVPLWFDQPTNAKYIVDIWRVGIRVPVHENSGIVLSEGVAACIKEMMMEGEKREKTKENALKFKELAVEAMDSGGTSDHNINQFIVKLVSM